jgi:hypothetical protein
LLPLHLLWAAAKVHPHLSHLQSHLEDDWLLVAAAVDVAVVHDVAAIIAAAFAGAVLLVAADADAAAVAAVSVAVPELSVVVSKHHLTYNLLQWLK